MQSYLCIMAVRPPEMRRVLKSTGSIRVLEVDHIIPRSGGGQDHIKNLQLLRGHCNRVRGDRQRESRILV